MEIRNRNYGKEAPEYVGRGYEYPHRQKTRGRTSSQSADSVELQYHGSLINR